MYYCFAKLCCCIFGIWNLNAESNPKIEQYFTLNVSKIFIKISALNFVCNFPLDAQSALGIEHFQHFINRLYPRRGVSERYRIWLLCNVWYTQMQTSYSFLKKKRKNATRMDLSRTWVCFFLSDALKSHAVRYEIRWIICQNDGIATYRWHNE